MVHIKLFSEIDKQSTLIAGGKAASLGEMTKLGIPVPNGFVVLTSAFDQFLADADLTQEISAQIEMVNHEDIASVERASETIRALIMRTDFPKQLGADIQNHFDLLGTEVVAVRSSATAEDGSSASWAGELDTFLNTTKPNLLEAIRKCWASLFTPRAIFYRFEKGFKASHVSVAVIVQDMVQSDVSGIAFSVHPVTADPNQLIIEAGLGLGEAIVSGSITPDAYVVDKRDFQLVHVSIADQKRALYRAQKFNKDEYNVWQDVSPKDGQMQKLSNDKIIELAKLVVQIEKHYGFPCDIEWAVEAGVFYITQSRPITTLA